MKIKQSLFRFANRLLAPLPIALERSERLAELRAAEMRLRWHADLAAHVPNPATVPQAQIGQDLFALLATSFMSDGYFVEFGAADGVSFSNTLLLERSFDWTGIVAEPARIWHEALRKNRQCIVDTRCVWERSGQALTFAEPADAFRGGLNDYMDTDKHRPLQQDAATVNYPVETVSLTDLLEEHAAPTRIDYLSVDTEGTEFEILNAFDFERFDVRVITVEHAYNQSRRKRVHTLLEPKGFTRVLPEVSLWDDWYVNRTLTPAWPL